MLLWPEDARLAGQMKITGSIIHARGSGQVQVRVECCATAVTGVGDARLRVVPHHRVSRARCIA